MLSETSIVRRAVVRSIVALFVVAVATAAIVSPATAQTVNVSLNVFYDDPLTPATSGGVWSIVAKTAGSQGLAALDLKLRNIVVPPPTPVGPRGIVNGTDPAGFSELTPFGIGGGITEIVIGQRPIGADSLGPGEEEAVFYGVGLIANGQPGIALGGIGPSFTSLTSKMAIPWATGDPLGDPAWATAARLATGTFLAGMTPAFDAGGATSSASVFTTIGTSTVYGLQALVSPANFTAIVRTGGSPDYNDDGTVDAADYTVWRDTLGQMGAGLAADGNLDMVVNTLDYNYWKANFGTVFGSPGAGAGGLGGAGIVPEPTAVALWLGATGTVFLRPKRRLLRIVMTV
jgi:hypothetical protein